jgi:cation transporter-like permease
MKQKFNQSPPDFTNAGLPIYTDVNNVPLSLVEQLSGHWRVIVEQKRRQHDVNMRQIVLGQLFTIITVAAVSVMVETNKEALLLVGSTLILYPSLVDLMVSNAAVLVASIHHDVDAERGNHFIYVAATTARALLVSTLACGLVGILASVLGWIVFAADMILTLKLALLAGLLTGLVGMPLLVSITFITRRMHANPDDINPPVINTIFNVLALVAIGISSRILT